MSLFRVAAVFLIVVTLSEFGTPKVYKRCELVRELTYKFKLPANQVPTWTCIAYYESKYNTTRTSKINKNGSRDHGLFQINDNLWCSPRGKGCGVTCASVKTDDITQAVNCIKRIWTERQRTRGNGFTAWTTYKFCDTPNKVNRFVADC